MWIITRLQREQLDIVQPLPAGIFISIKKECGVEYPTPHSKEKKI